MNKLVSLVRKEDGQGMAEYGLIIVLVAIAVYAAVKLLGGNLGGTFSNIASDVA